ncbi:MAG: uracil-DNA glycosylase [Gammaproteobacteria bacterium]|jgi:uracil-DNA glycosylase family 4|nr:uracil-DNA glycosylase [Gammaproteobacteria bacterium]
MLPEELRRYYLDAMGIQVWEALQPEAAPVAAAQEVVEPVVAEKSVDDVPMVEPGAAESTAVDKPTQATPQPDLSSCNWPELEALVQHCDQCGLQATRTQTVFGAGKQTASLLVIGEAPTLEEDAQGEPFVGAAGQLLSAMLQAIGLQREDVYITSILKCHTPDGRDPLPAELAHCRHYLHRQIELLQPKVILAVGRVAAQALLDSKEKISALRGIQHSYSGRVLIASYHPVYLMHKPSEKRKAWQDLLQVKRLLAG